MKRYDQLIDIVREVRPETIVEIGVHKGLRAALMCREALKYRERITYVGFDVFATESEEFHEAALNGKGMPSKDLAAHRLNAIGPALTWQFVEGDTRKTLHGETRHADLVFIDGDHRLEVIRGDYAAFKDAKCIVADDFYAKLVGDHCPVNLDVHGCNRLIEELEAMGRSVEKLPIADRCSHGAYAQLVAIWP